MVSKRNPRPMTLTQKILAHRARNLTRPWVEAGDVLQIAVDWTIASELAWNGMERTWELLGRPEVHDKERFFLAVDHTVDPVTLANDRRAQKLTQLSRDFAKQSGIRHFYDANVTILFGVITPKRATGEHLKTLARVSRLLRNKDFRARLVGSPDEHGAFELIRVEEGGSVPSSRELGAAAASNLEDRTEKKGAT